MTSEISESEIQSRSGGLRVSENIHFANDRGANIPSYNSNNAPSSRPLGSGPVLQSTVKVEGRKENSVDRYKVCPSLLRVFYTYNHHHNPLDYKNKIYPKNEMQIHTWMDATLSEILVHLQHKNRKVRRSGTVIHYQIVSPDPARPRFRMKDIGSVKVDHKGPDDYITLAQCRLGIGDFIDICIKLPKS